MAGGGVDRPRPEGDGLVQVSRQPAALEPVVQCEPEVSQVPGPERVPVGSRRDGLTEPDDRLIKDVRVPQSVEEQEQRPRGWTGT